MDRVSDEFLKSIILITCDGEILYRRDSNDENKNPHEGVYSIQEVDIDETNSSSYL